MLFRSQACLEATVAALETYAGDGLWSKQEDIYNPMKFLETTMAWCKKAEALGTLPEVAEEWMRKVGGRGRR